MIIKSLLPLVTKRHVERRFLPEIAAERLLKVVVDVNAYQDFLPYCRHSRVTKRFPNSDSFQATLTVGIPPVLLETYVSHVVVTEEESPHGTTPESGAAAVATAKAFTVTTRSIQSQYLESLWSQWKLRDATKRTEAYTSPYDSKSRDPLSSSPPSISSKFPLPQNVGDKKLETIQHSGCHVEFEVQMSVRDPIIAAALDQLLPKVAVQQVDAFVARCRGGGHQRRHQ
jgi:ribosome-associated toxin RatA of RatAB toxin-antitoxin module